MSGAVTIRRCASLPEALVVSALLRAHGFNVCVDNHHHAANQWWLVPGFDGVSLSVPGAEGGAARDLIIERARTGPALLEKAFGPYEPAKRYGRVALWYMILDYTLGLPSLICGLALAGVLSLIGAILPLSWFQSSASGSGPPWIPEVNTGSFDPVYNTHFEPEGILFVACVVLVFLADRLIKPQQDKKDERP
ncbi:MAG: hypothetical protein WA989_14355 [Henriciella sp.]|uniref:hypothetical protein n=1 Tax=Henriciella sp. TaxID=1968823 RepID=UPI003C72C896